MILIRLSFDFISLSKLKEGNFAIKVILRIFGLVIKKTIGGCIFLHKFSKYNFRLYLVQEFCCGGELFRRMEFERLMLEKDALFYLSEIVIALEYLHSKVLLRIESRIKKENEHSISSNKYCL